MTEIKFQVSDADFKKLNNYKEKHKLTWKKMMFQGMIPSIIDERGLLKNG